MRQTFLALLLLVAGCTSTAEPPQPSGSPPGSPGPPVTAACVQPSGDQLPEAHGSELWALIFHRLVPGEEIKIVLRATGSGQISVKAIGPNGNTIDPVWGPEPHLSSTWDRPGDEYGTGWLFPEPGCWVIRTTRPTGIGEVELPIAVAGGP